MHAEGHTCCMSLDNLMAVIIIGNSFHFFNLHLSGFQCPNFRELPETVRNFSEEPGMFGVHAAVFLYLQVRVEQALTSETSCVVLYRLSCLFTFYGDIMA